MNIEKIREKISEAIHEDVLLFENNKASFSIEKNKLTDKIIKIIVDGCEINN